LDRVRRDGDWETWLSFFLEGVQRTAEGAVLTAQELAGVFQVDRSRIAKRGRRAGSALRVHDALKTRPLSSVQEVCRTTGLSFPRRPRRWNYSSSSDHARVDWQAPEPPLRVRPLSHDPERRN
jgi:Fic family protein